MKLLDRVLQNWRIRKVLPYIQPTSRVLDIGAADGTLFHRIPTCREYVGIDLLVESHHSIAPNAMLRSGQFPDALSVDDRFDIICMLAVIEHVPPNGQRALAGGCADHLVSGGKLLITVPSPRVDRILDVLHALRVIDGMSLEQHYGFDVERTSEIFADTSLSLVHRRRFQLGLNNLFVFENTTVRP